MVVALAEPFADSSVGLVPLFDSFIEALVATWVDSLVDSSVCSVLVHKMGTGIIRAEI